MASKSFTIQISNPATEKTKTINVSNPASEITKTQTAAFSSSYGVLYNFASNPKIEQSYFNTPTYVDAPDI